VDRLVCCLQSLGDILPSMPGDPTTNNFNKDPQAWNLWCCHTKEVLITFFTEGPESDCAIVDRISKGVCPDPADQDFAAQMTDAITAITSVLLDALLACFCHTLLPPAPCGTSEDRIPLAVVRVRKRDCKVMSVCNFTPLRKTVITFPTLAYWLSWIPWWGALGDVIHTLCCTPLFSQPQQPRDVEARMDQPRDAAYVRGNPTPSPKVVARNQTFATLLKRAVARGGAPIDPKDLVGGLLGINLGGTQPLSKEERANPQQVMMLNQVVRPIAASLFAGTPAAVMRTAATSAGEANALKARVAKLEEDIKALKKHR